MAQTLRLAFFCALFACGNSRPFIPAANVGGLAVEGGEIIYAQGAGLFAVPATGGVPRQIANVDGVCTGIALDPARAIFTTNKGRAIAVPRAGQGAIEILAQLDGPLLAPAIDGANVLLSEGQRVLSIAPNGTQALVGQPPRGLTSFAAGPREIFYLADGIEVGAIARATGAARIIESTAAPLGGPAVDDRNAYYWAGKLRAAPIDGGAAFDFADPGASGATSAGVVTGLGAIVFATLLPQAGTAAIWRANANAPGAVSVLSASARRQLGPLAYADSVVYWVEADGIHQAGIE